MRPTLTVLPALLVPLLLPLGPAPARAAPPISGGGAINAATIKVERPWARATAPGQVTGVVYATLLSPAGDRLFGVGSPDADMAMLHENAIGDDNSTVMRDLAFGLPLPAGKPVTLHPGGTHLMLMGLHQPLVAGGIVTVSLTFEQAGTIKVAVPVEPLNATGPGTREAVVKPAAPPAGH